MTQQDETLNTEPSIPDGAPTQLNDSPGTTDNLNRQKRSVDNESAADRKRGSGGLDSLGGGRLP